MYKVFINPGHSAKCSPDPGACSNGYKEAEIAAKIGAALARKLHESNIEAQVYQQTGKAGSTANAQLNSVPKVANATDCDIFVSIHLNAATATAKGTETLYLAGSEKGKKLANCINTSMTKAFDGYTFVNRGAKEDVRGLLVLKATKMPAVLVETGFITNKDEITFIASHIEDIAQRLYEGICNYFNVKAKTFEAITVKTNMTIKLAETSEGLFDCYVNDELKLHNNKLTTCLNWIASLYSA